jgi:hypothetical protein
MWSQPEITARLQDTVSAWQSWSAEHQAYVDPWRDLVHHSGRVLQALSFQPTGAICAAATHLSTRDGRWLPQLGLPLRLGSRRLLYDRGSVGGACPDEANEFFDYMATSAAGSLEEDGDLQIMFGIGGERDLTERELPHLAGWRCSVPVRVGNGAWRQRQLDVYGELLSAVCRLSDHLVDSVARRVGPMADPEKWGQRPDLAPASRAFLIELADSATRRWQEKDHGI